ncbi:MAG: recombination protein RecR [Gammaproteobacteria bacterium]|nr:recombination protein RecR [Gammaproteobacteria bacterium]NIM71766.1 recombination protein RecR [Gammaproteobacteria bacterium]NIN37862.1 recombination protein RecR [Gammaproteobacteria bacterium]NIO23522.1 recombination protein RecR [Gammaproteobacteria bacterium]NIO64138.1 recombination protein RecR [Gammaproteobacteria bacterium]
MSKDSLIQQLINAFRCLPGVGPKSAQRMTFYLLQRDRQGGRHLAESLVAAMSRVGNCRRCRTLSEKEVCAICENPKRDASQLCVVESPADMAAIEHGTGYRGQFFVLGGHLSPLDGIGPDELGVALLAQRLSEGEVGEVIIATGSTVEGQATAHYISELVHEKGIRVTRIAQGVPLGGELEFVDSSTLDHAIGERQSME